jgi:hypothetical protein
MDDDSLGCIVLTVIIVVVALIIWFAVKQCSSPASEPTPTATYPLSTKAPTPPEEGARVRSDSQVQRRASVVWAGPEDLLSELNVDDWQDLCAGYVVTTDESGEACIRVKDCLDIYVFNLGELRESECPKSESSGYVYCNMGGMQVFNDACAEEVIIETLTAEGAPSATYVSVAYIPSLQLSLFLLSDGEMRVRPVTDFENRTMGSAVYLTEEQFYFTAPDDIVRDIGGLPAREALPFAEFPLFLQDLRDEEPNLVLWIEKLTNRAYSDGFPPTQPLLGIIVRGGGWELEEEPIQEAILASVDWNMLRENYPDSYENVPITVEWQDSGIVISDARDISYDPEAAKASMEAGGYSVPEIWLIFPDWDAGLVLLADEIEKGLDSLEIRTNVNYAWGPDARVAMSSLIDDGQSVLWLSRW